MTEEGNTMLEITVGICEAFKEIGIDISEEDLGLFEKALYERGLHITPRQLLYQEGLGPSKPLPRT